MKQIKKLYINRKWLYNEYINKDKQIKKIAEESNVSTTVIHFWIKRLKILKKIKTNVFTLRGKKCHTSKKIKYKNNIPHIKCLYFKRFLPITEFCLSLNKKSKIYTFQQPSRPAIRKIKHLKGQKPKKIKNKLIKGRLYRNCCELNKFLPITNFGKYTRNGKILYTGISKMGQSVRRKERYAKATNKAIKDWKKKNKYKVRIYDYKRKGYKKYSTPKWLSQKHFAQMQSIYDVNSKLQKKTKIKHHVHHIYPLRGKDVYGNHISCGLNVPWNLVSIKAKINLKIGSKNPEFHEFIIPESPFFTPILR